MKLLTCLLSPLLLALALAPQPAHAQDGVIASSGPAALSPIDQLTGPIALYPDPLIALILPAATFPTQIAGAFAYVTGGGDPSRIDVQPWDDSVKGLAHYPGVLEWMAQNPDWTAALGAAFANNPSDVMGSIQRLREMAKAAGTLGDTPQQDVVEDGGELAIEPVDPNAIYVPSYDPAVVFVAGPYFGYYGPYLTFGPACAVGPWLAFQFDWHHSAVWHGDWRNWRTAHGWSHPVFPGHAGFIRPQDAHAWHPSPAAVAASRSAREAPGIRPAPSANFPRPPEPARAAHSPWANPRSVPQPTSAAPQMDRYPRAPQPPQNRAEARPQGQTTYRPSPEYSTRPEYRPESGNHVGSGNRSENAAHHLGSGSHPAPHPHTAPARAQPSDKDRKQP